MRLFAIGLAMLCAGCAPAPAPVEKPKPDITKEAWYAATSADLAALNTKARSYLQQGKKDEAAALIVKGQPLAERLLAASRPTLAAMEAASDLDQMYAEMLLSNRNFGWARLGFQKNVSRWKNWRPRTEDTARRLEQALAGMRECDRRIAE